MCDQLYKQICMCSGQKKAPFAEGGVDTGVGLNRLGEGT